MALGERRDNNRVNVHKIAVYKVLDGQTENNKKACEVFKVRNLSGTGALVHVDAELNTADAVSVEISFGAGKGVKILCEVDWCKANAAEGGFDAGLIFMALKDSDEIILSEFLVAQQEKP